MSILCDFSATTIDGDERKLSDFDAKVCLLVNVASECGLTPQFDGLQRLYSPYRDREFEILGFPCNQFGGQEPGSDEEIREFCRTNHGVGDIAWNFAKFLVGRDGTLIARFSPTVEPCSTEVTARIDRALEKP
jgi:glutathione peroxidase